MTFKVNQNISHDYGYNSLKEGDKWKTFQIPAGYEVIPVGEKRPVKYLKWVNGVKYWEIGKSPGVKITDDLSPICIRNLNEFIGDRFFEFTDENKETFLLPPIPVGWRFIKKGETIKKGQLYRSYSTYTKGWLELIHKRQNEYVMDGVEYLDPRITPIEEEVKSVQNTPAHIPIEIINNGDVFSNGIDSVIAFVHPLNGVTFHNRGAYTLELALHVLNVNKYKLITNINNQLNKTLELATKKYGEVKPKPNSLIPEGWRELKDEEVIKKGDQYILKEIKVYSMNQGKTVKESKAGFSKDLHPIYIRKL